MSAAVVRSTALRAGGACVRCRKGKTKCVYENGRAPCKNCAKGMHECYLPSESMAAGTSPARHTAVHRPARESLPSVGAADPRAANPAAIPARHAQSGAMVDKLTPEMIAECERIVSRTYPACVAFHKPTFITQLKNSTIEGSLLYALLCTAARSSPNLIRRYGAQGGATGAAEHFAIKAMNLIQLNLDTPSLADIQAMCLIIIHEWGSRQAVRAYVYLGQAARMVQMYCVLHSHHNGMVSDNFLQEESFRRALWLLYILDCLLTSHPGRQPALSGADIVDVSLPCSDMNFAFGNAVVVETLSHVSPSRRPPGVPGDVVGEFGQIIRATRIWREVVHMLMSTTVETFNDATCTELMNSIEDLRRDLPMQFIDKPGQINLHITMGSGFTYAMLHCMLHCSSIFINRRRLLQYVTSPNFDIESWRNSPQCHDLVDRLLTSCHSTIAMLTALEAGFDKESIPCFPVVMLFSAFTASATVAYLSLKNLTPPNAVETAGHIVRDGLRFMQEGVDTWPLIASWLRHLCVMQRVLVSDAGGLALPAGPDTLAAGSVRDDASNAGSNNPDAMEYDHVSNSGNVPSNPSQQPGGSAGDSGRDSEPPAAIRRPGVTTINGGSANGGTPNPSSPPPPAQPEIKRSPGSPSAVPVSNGSHEHVPERDVSVPQDMTAGELCNAFERQLLELDDLAAFMGGGV
ncbi:fungal-specific transcription factor domain-containing protein [Plectosphaerella plurivora]|uniref:Fungal-specific transcription factor domain-containing protein n=1 Tax=Plectosphaerella plurivora TaxID=936078 RepID=A0A9P8V884_9PEZI|nr:fungal-specific transcription factor domain-containing protein [Plectosphaerella plurivora]